MSDSERPRKPVPAQGAGPAAITGPIVILVEPQLAENIGMAARAMANFTLDELRLVAPRDGWPNPQALAAAAGANAIVENARLFDRLEDAVGDCHWLAATTARPRDIAKRVLTPQDLAAESRQRQCAGQRVAILFGRERWGLVNEEVALADVIVTAPVNPAFASLNLAQSVLLIAYEWMKQSGGATLGRKTQTDGPAKAGLNVRASRPASKQEFAGLIAHLEQELARSGFLKPPEKRPTMMRNIKTMLARMEPTEQEVRTLRGIVASLVRAHKKGSDAP